EVRAVEPDPLPSDARRPTVLRRALFHNRRHDFRRSHGEEEELHHSGLRTQSRRLGFRIRKLQVRYGRLFRESRTTIDVLDAMNRFLEFMLAKSEAYQWKSCLVYAMRHHQSVKADSVHKLHSREAWLDHPRIHIDHNFNHFSAPPGSSVRISPCRTQHITLIPPIRPEHPAPRHFSLSASARGVEQSSFPLPGPVT
ncbi:hypothetical protein E4U19_008197, partial [Claviceps sp. Clav32 group G5]